jgi:hypothetical protein
LPSASRVEDLRNVFIKYCACGGSASHWQFEIYRASHDDYDESVFFTGLPVGTCQDALDTACGLYLNDPTAWTRPPTNLRARPLSLTLSGILVFG